MTGDTYLRECTIVPNITMMRETIADESESTTFDVLFDRVEGLLFRDFHLCIRPARYFDDHIQDSIVAICEEGDIVERGDNISVLFDEDPVFYSEFRQYPSNQ
jgi:hypothetical protein